MQKPSAECDATTYKVIARITNDSSKGNRVQLRQDDDVWSDKIKYSEYDALSNAWERQEAQEAQE